MAGLGDLFGQNGALEQLLLWGVVNQVISTLGSPAFTALQQDIMAKHPDVALTPDVVATAVAHHLWDEKRGEKEAALSGTNHDRFHTLLRIATVRLSPADLAEAVLRSYLTADEAQSEATPQGYTPEQMRVMADLAGDAPGPQMLAEALRRGIIESSGRGANSTSYEQGIAESRLHAKWGHMVRELSRVLLSPPDAASAVVRNFMEPADAERIAAESGVSRETFQVMRHLAGDAPGPQQAAEALRRGLIPADGTGPGSISFRQAIAEGRLADKWAPVIEGLAKLWPTPVDALDAALKGQVTPAEGERLYELLGGDLQFYPWLLDSQGEAPTPLEAIQMANRGIIKWDGVGPKETTYAQAFHEGRWRNKWQEAYRKLGEYVPPESAVITLLSHGSIGNEQAADLLAKQGMTEDVIKAYLDEAHSEALSDYRGLTVTTVLDGYYEQIISPADAVTILTALHVTESAARILLAYVDMRRSFAAVNSAISRVRSLYAARKITEATARAALNTLKVPPTQIDPIIEAWSVENSISVKLLTEAQIVDGWEIGALTQDEAITELTNIGYTPFDAWVIMSIKAKAPQANRPVRGPAPPQSQVVPGTT